MRGRWFFVVLFVLLMLWFLGNIVLSPYARSFFLGHNEPDMTSTEMPTMIWVPYSMSEVLERVVIVVGFVTFLSSFVSYFFYKSMKNS